MNTYFRSLFRAGALPAGGMGERLRAVFAPRKPRHPLLRVGLGLLGVALLAVLLVLGLFVGAAMLATGVLMRLFRQAPRPDAGRGRLVEAEYRVVPKPVLPQAR